MAALEAVSEWATNPQGSNGIQIVVETDEGRKCFDINQKPVYLLGRKEPDVDICCPEKMCSRVHACIAHRKGKFYLVDLGSVAGTSLDGTDLQANKRAELIPGKSEFRLGPCLWRFRVEHSSAHSDQADTPEGRGRDSGRGDQTENVVDKERKRQRHPEDDRHEDSGSRFRQRSYHGPNEPGHRARESDSRARYRDEPRRGDSRDRGGGRDNHRFDARHDAHWNERSDDRRKWEGNRHASGSRSQERQPRRKGGRSQSPEEDLRERPRGAGQYNQGDSGRFNPPVRMPVQQKKALLWGNKSSTTETQGSNQFGNNRWDTANFENEEERAKFNKLMGVRGPTQGPMSQPQAPCEREEGGVLSGDAQIKVLTEVEGHFMQGLRRADGRKVGLGL